MQRSIVFSLLYAGITTEIIYYSLSSIFLVASK